MSRRLEPDRHTIQIHTSSYAALQQLINEDALISQDRPEKEAADPVKGVRSRATYRLHSTGTIEILSDAQIRVAGVTLRAEVPHLPTPCYQALVSASPAFTQYPGVDTLFRGLRDGTLTREELTQDLEAAVAQGRQPDSTPRMVLSPHSFSASWLADEVFFFKSFSGHWFVSLSFRLHFQRQSRALKPVVIGLDLGLNPLTAATDGTDDRVFDPSPVPSLHRHDLSAPAWALYQDLLYASGRADAEAVIGHLVHRASSVYAERLTHGGMSRRFVHGGRACAIHDYHFSWLSQFLNAARIPFKRVAPAGTSQICHRCGHCDPRNRSRDEFRCLNGRCQYCGDAHINAARVIRQRGLAISPRSRVT